jgi:hypothetical protein
VSAFYAERNRCEAQSATKRWASATSGRCRGVAQYLCTVDGEAMKLCHQHDMWLRKKGREVVRVSLPDGTAMKRKRARR